MSLRLLTRFTLASSLALATAVPSYAFETRATSAWVFDATANVVLLEKDAERPLPPASMSKLMTLFMLFEAIRDGRVKLTDEFNVSSRAAAMGGSKMFLKEGDRPTVEELIRGIIVNSGNDACVVVAEGLAGSEETFAGLATDRARALGMKNTTLGNSSGWPHPNHRMSMHDLGILAEHLIEDFPEFYGYFGETAFNYKDRVPANAANRNPLLRLGVGADGLKTGHTQEAGYGLVGSVKQGDRRVIFVITGLQSEAERAQESERVVNWAFRQFSMQTVAPAGQRVAEVPVWMGDRDRVGVKAGEAVQALVPAGRNNDIAARVEWDAPLRAPLKADTPVGQLVVSVPDMPEIRTPVYLESDVAAAGFGRRLTLAAQELAKRATAQIAF